MMQLEVVAIASLAEIGIHQTYLMAIRSFEVVVAWSLELRGLQASPQDHLSLKSDFRFA